MARVEAAVRRSVAEVPATRTEADMLARLRTLEAGTQRHTVLVSAIDFKRSWLELAAHLTEVRRSGGYKGWGYRTFEAYAQHELHLKRETALKLVRSYDFLDTHEAEHLRAVRDAPSGDPPSTLPDFEVLDILAGARNNANLAEEDYREIRDQVFQEQPAPSLVRRLVRERAEPTEPEKDEDPEAALRRCLALAERLYGMLLDATAPTAVCQHAERTVGGLRRHLDG